MSMLGTIVLGYGQAAGWLAIASLGACQCAFDAGKLDQLACSTTAECALGQDCLAGTCTQRGCHDAHDCGDPATFTCVDGFCESTGRRDAGGGTDAGSDAGTDAAVQDDAGLDAGLDAASDDGGADGGTPPGDCGEDEPDLAGTYDDDHDPGTPEVGLQEIAYGCAFQCFDGGPGCSADCIVAATDGAISPPCALCLEDTGNCAVQSCVFECLGDPHAAACVACGCDNCAATFLVCGGVPLPWCVN